jgi:hypothetical protein
VASQIVSGKGLFQRALIQKRRLCQLLCPPICVQLVYKNAVLKGLKLDLSNAESTTDSWATGPNIAEEPLTSISLYSGLVYFAIVRNLRFGTRQQVF